MTAAIFDRQNAMLLASIHDVGPRFEREIDLLADLFTRRLGSARFAMLVVPNHWGEAPLRAGTPFAAKLRGWADAGVEMFVHGWFHRDTARHIGAARLKARWMTASEGEFLGLDQGEAARRMADGQSLIEDITGRTVAGFIAPAWLYGAGAHAALAQSGFALAEDHFSVWSPRSGQRLARGPVVTWASRSAPRRLSSRAVAAAARLALHRQRVVRIAAHPGDTTRPELLQSITRTLDSFASRRPVCGYAALLQPAGAAIDATTYSNPGAADAGGSRKHA